MLGAPFEWINTRRRSPAVHYTSVLRVRYVCSLQLCCNSKANPDTSAPCTARFGNMSIELNIAYTHTTVLKHLRAAADSPVSQHTDAARTHRHAGRCKMVNMKLAPSVQWCTSTSILALVMNMQSVWTVVSHVLLYTR